MTVKGVEALIRSGVIVVILPEKVHPFADEEEAAKLVKQAHGLSGCKVRVMYLNPDKRRLDD